MRSLENYYKTISSGLDSYEKCFREHLISNNTRQEYRPEAKLKNINTMPIFLRNEINLLKIKGPYN